MKNYREFFKNKKITVMGLGLLGRGVGDAMFLAECGAKLTVTDLKTKKELAESLVKLKRFKNIKYVLGRHRLPDFRNCDLVLKAAGVPLDSVYIREARKNKIPVEMDESLFAKLAPGVKIIGVTGTRGKSTVATLVYEILKRAGLPAHLGGNIRGRATLQLLGEVQEGDIVVLELSSWQLQGFGEAKISPPIAVFTNFLSDHQNYYGSTSLTTGQALKKYFTDKSYIYKFQNKNDFLILGPNMKGMIRDAKGKVLNASLKNIPKSWRVNLLGRHNLENIACVIEVARILKAPEKIIKKAVENFQAIPGRLEFVKNIRGVKIYNDTNSTTSDALVAALNSFSKKVILIMGGMDKGPEVEDLNKILPIKTKRVFLLPGSGGDKINWAKIKVKKVSGLVEAIREAREAAKRGDIILFSPGFASFNMFKSEYDRGDQFMKIVKKLR